MSLEDSGYRGIVLEKLADAGAHPSDTIRVVCGDREYVGVLMPRAQVGTDPSHLVIKLESGYNVGVKLDSESLIEVVSRHKKKRRPISTELLEPTEHLPAVAFLSTGGTIASKVDYRTGAVNPALSASDLYDAVPELRDHANLKCRILMSLLSENITPEDWTKIAKAVATEIRHNVDGVVIAHGTDTMGFTAAALSFALQNLPVPVALVGSQRSSDRPSSDAALNLISATDLVGSVDAAEVMVVMHGVTDDSFCLAHRGTHVRKMHTSRRDAFQSINGSPLFKIEHGNITELNPPLLRRDPSRKLKLRPKFEPMVALIKTYPGIDKGLIHFLINNGYRGIVLEGTGLGHVPESIHSSIATAIDSGVVVTMTSQCLFGRVNMNVYRPGVELLQLGVIPCENTLPETALVKLMWLLANEKNPDRVKLMMNENLVGELTPRSSPSSYLMSGGN